MSDQLPRDEIAALVDAAGGATVAPQAPSLNERRPRWLRRVDFTRPTKFSTEQTRRLTRVIEAWCRAASTRMSAERVPITLELLDVSQLTWTNAHDQVPADSVVSLLGLKEHDGRWVLTSELPLMLAALESLLGGHSDDGAPAERKLTDIDLVLVRRVLGALVEPLSTLFQDLAAAEVEIKAVDPASDLAYMENASEPTLVFTMEARLVRNSAVLTLIVPHGAIEDILSHFSTREDEAAGYDAASMATLRDGLHGVDVTARAEVADARMTVGEVLALKPGDVVRFDAPITSDVTLYADRTPLHRARPGHHGQRRAVQIAMPREPGGSVA